MNKVLLLMLGVMFLMGAAIDWIEFKEDLKEMQDEETDETESEQGENDNR